MRALKKNIIHNYFRIDNLSIGEERSLIYGSVSIRCLIKNFLPLRIQNDLQLRSEIYTIKQDYRTPNTKI